MKSTKYDLLNAGYMYYYASDVIFSPGGSSEDAEKHEARANGRLEERLNELMGDLLIAAKSVRSSSIMIELPTRRSCERRR